MTAFNMYYHDADLLDNKVDRDRMHDLSDERTLEYCALAYENTAHDLEVIFAPDGLLATMVKDGSYQSNAVFAKCSDIYSIPLKAELEQAFQQNNKKSSKEALVKCLSSFLIYTENYATNNKVEVSALVYQVPAAQVPRKDKFKARIVAGREKVLQFPKERFRQIYIVDYLVSIAPVFDDIENVFGNDGLFAALTVALEEIAQYDKKNYCVIETERLKQARQTIDKLCKSITQSDLRDLLLSTCNKICSVAEFDRAYSPQALSAIISRIMLPNLEKWYETFSRNVCPQLRNLNQAPEFGIELQCSPKWLQDAYFSVAGRQVGVSKLVPDTIAVKKAANDLGNTRRYELPDFSVKNLPMSVQVKLFGSTVLKHQMYNNNSEPVKDNHDLIPVVTTLCDLDDLSSFVNGSSSSSSANAAATSSSYWDELEGLTLTEKPKKPEKPAKPEKPVKPPKDNNTNGQEIKTTDKPVPPPKPKKPIQVNNSLLSWQQQLDATTGFQLSNNNNQLDVVNEEINHNNQDQDNNILIGGFNYKQ